MKGTYLFFARLDAPRQIRIDKKGTVRHFKRGWYAYVGSAFNAGGLKSRLNRHYLGSANKHWHIDFFRTGVIPHPKAWICCEARRLESIWSAVFQQLKGVTTPVLRFGNSDKAGSPALHGATSTHLFYAVGKPRIEEFQLLLDGYVPDCRPVKEIRLPI